MKQEQEKGNKAIRVNQQNDEQINEDRRKTVRDLLSGAGTVAAVAATSPVWIEPVVNAVALPAHAQMSNVTAMDMCCPYYFDAVQNWCYDDGAAQNGNTGPVPGGFSVYNWDQPDNCPVP